MTSRGLINRVVGAVLTIGAVVFVALLAGVGSAQLTDEPPAVSPYQVESPGRYESASSPAPTPAQAPADDVAVPVQDPQVTAAEVVIEGFGFGPDELRVPLGATVTFVNRESGVPHTSTSDDDLWKSRTLNPGDSFSFTFETAGTFSYFCSIHPSMRAAITVGG